MQNKKSAVKMSVDEVQGAVTTIYLAMVSDWNSYHFNIYDI